MSDKFKACLKARNDFDHYNILKEVKSKRNVD